MPLQAANGDAAEFCQLGHRPIRPPCQGQPVCNQFQSGLHAKLGKNCKPQIIDIRGLPNADCPAATERDCFSAKELPALLRGCAVARLRGCAVARLRGCAVARFCPEQAAPDIASFFICCTPYLNRIPQGCQHFFDLFLLFFASELIKHRWINTDFRQPLRATCQFS